MRGLHVTHASRSRDLSRHLIAVSRLKRPVDFISDSFLREKRMPTVIVISDDEQEELNITRHPNLSSPIPPERFLGNESLTERNVKVNLEAGPPRERKRIRRRLDSDEEPLEVKDVPKAKRTKREERKSVSVFFRCVIYRIVAAARVDWISPHVFGPKSSSPS